MASKFKWGSAVPFSQVDSGGEFLSSFSALPIFFNELFLELFKLELKRDSSWLHEWPEKWPIKSSPRTPRTWMWLLRRWSGSKRSTSSRSCARLWHFLFIIRKTLASDLLIGLFPQYEGAGDSAQRRKVTRVCARQHVKLWADSHLTDTQHNIYFHLDVWCAWQQNVKSEESKKSGSVARTYHG